MFRKLRWLIGKKTEFKVEKVCNFKKGGGYLFVLTTDRPITDRMYRVLREVVDSSKGRLMKDLGIISSFIILDDGLDIRVVPSGGKRELDPKLKSYIEKGYTPIRKENL